MKSRSSAFAAAQQETRQNESTTGIKVRENEGETKERKKDPLKRRRLDLLLNGQLAQW